MTRSTTFFLFILIGPERVGMLRLRMDDFQVAKSEENIMSDNKTS